MQCCAEFANESQNNGDAGSPPHDLGVEILGEHNGAGDFRVGGVGRSSKHGGGAGGQTVTQQGAVQARLFQVVLSGHVADGQHVTDVFNGRRNGDRDHEQHGAPAELRRNKVGNGEPGGFPDWRGIHDTGKRGEDVAGYNAEHDRNQPENAFRPDRHDDGYGQRDHGDPDGSVVGNQLVRAITGAA